MTGEATADDLVGLAAQVAERQTPIQELYSDALLARETEEQEIDERFNSAAGDYASLHHHVESSTSLLASLETFLGTFQSDLSAVSGHISELQQRSRLIDARLQARKSLHTQLGPIVASISIPPELVDIIIETEPSEAWLEPISILEDKLTAIRSGPRVAERQSLDDTAEKLRLHATEKLRRFLITIITPFRTSVSANLQTTQSTTLIKYRPFYAFLQRHAARQAHEVQKFYISSAVWYYETGFRRYTRALEKIRLRSIAKEDGQPNGESGSLTALLSRNISSSTVNTPKTATANESEAVTYSRIEGPPLLLGYQADSRDATASVEALFRCILVVLADNAASEYNFIQNFFGRPAASSPRIPNKESNGWHIMTKNNNTSMSQDDDRDTFDDSMSVISASEIASPAQPGIDGLQVKAEKVRRSTTDHIWKQVMMPVTEYCKSFITSLIAVSPPPTSTLAMIRLCDAVSHALIIGQQCPTKAIEDFLFGIKLSLWPLFQKEIGALTENVKKLTTAATATTSLFGSKTAGIKDAVVQKTVARYITLFNTIVSLSEQEDEDMVFSGILRLRNELQKLLIAQASRIADKAQSRAYLSMQYEDLLSGLSVSFASCNDCFNIGRMEWQHIHAHKQKSLISENLFARLEQHN